MEYVEEVVEELETSSIDFDSLKDFEYKALRDFLSHGTTGHITSREALRAECVKLGRAKVCLDRDEVKNGLKYYQDRRDEKLLAEYQISPCYVAVQKWKPKGNRFPRRNGNLLPLEVVIINELTLEEANARYHKRNRIKPISNMKPPRPEALRMKPVLQVSKHTQKSFKCSECDRWYKHQKSVNFHFKAKHLNLIRFRCATCGRTFLSKSNYDDHIKRHLKKPKFICAKCEKRFFTLGQLNKHASSCGINRKKRCPKCRLVVCMQQCLRVHVINELSNRVYQCGRCSHQFKHYASMYRHYDRCFQ